jgi:hypothetical protein
MENKLNKWFDAAKQHPPIISTKEVEAMISNPPAAKGGFSTIQKSIFMGTVLLIITSWLYWMNTTTQEETNNQNGVTSNEVINTNDTQKAMEEVSNFAKQLVIIPNTKTEAKQGAERIDIDEKWNEYFYSTPTNTTIYAPNNVEFVYLTNEELAGLGIVSDGKSFQYNTINGDKDSLLLSAEVNLRDDALLLMYSHKYWPNRNCNGQDMVKPHPAIISRDNSWYWLISEKDKIKYGYSEKFFNSVKHLLVPIAVPVEANSKKEILKSTFVFWYKPTADFLALLPQSVVYELKEKYGEYDSVVYARQWEAIIKQVQQISTEIEYSQKELDKIKLRALSLSQKELSKLGFYKSNSRNIYTNYYRTKDKVVKHVGIMEMEQKLYFTAPYLPPHKYKMWFSNDLIPLFISDSTISTIQSYHFQSNTENQFDDIIKRQKLFKKRMDTLIPVRYLLSDNKTVYYLWYAKTEAFLRALDPTTVSKLNEIYIGDERPMGNYLIPSINSYNYGKTDGSINIQLTNEELAVLGIITDGNTLMYENKNDSVSRGKSDDGKINLTTVFSVRVEEHGSRATNLGSLKDSIYLKNSLPFWPAALQVISGVDTSLNVIEALIYHDYEKVFFCDAKPYLVPVYCSTKARPGKYSHDLSYIFWFKPEELFWEHLPQFYVQHYKPLYNNQALENYVNIYRKFNFRESRNDIKIGFDTARVRNLEKSYIQLSKNELKKLNITKTEKGFRYANRFFQNNRVNQIVINQRDFFINIVINDKLRKNISIRTQDKPFVPVALTNTNIQNVSYLYLFPDSVLQGKENYSMDRFREEAEELIPIKVTDEYVLWFPETEAFIKTLPERIQKELGLTK